MFAKLLTVVLAMALTGVLLLGMRAQRLSEEHAIARLHQRIDAGRRAVWDAQVTVASLASPEAVRAKLAEAGRPFESVHASTSDPRHAMDDAGSVAARSELRE